MSLSYNDLFILNLFSISQPKKGSTVFHILQGKRTASILYRAVDYSLEPFFGFFPQLDRSTFYQKLEEFTTMGYLVYNQENQEYIHSLKGKEKVHTYLSTYYQPTHLNWLTQGRVIKDVQRKVYFLTQIFSEIRHNNNRYLPIEKDVDMQQWAKRWIAAQDKSLMDLAAYFGMEWKRLLSSIETKNAVILVHLMSGHDTVGLTKQQLAHQLHTTELEITVRQYDSLSYLIKQMHEITQEVPLFASIITEKAVPNENGLSNSAKETAVLLGKGYSIEQITHIRRLKKSTISEHLIEWAILFPSVDIHSFVPNKVYDSLKTLLTNSPDATFQEATNHIPGIEFWCYRLMQIERRRANEKPD